MDADAGDDRILRVARAFAFALGHEWDALPIPDRAELLVLARAGVEKLDRSEDG